MYAQGHAQERRSLAAAVHPGQAVHPVFSCRSLAAVSLCISVHPSVRCWLSPWVAGMGAFLSESQRPLRDSRGALVKVRDSDSRTGPGPARRRCSNYGEKFSNRTEAQVANDSDE